MSAELVHQLDKKTALLDEQVAKLSEHTTDHENRLSLLEKWQAKLSGQLALFIGIPMWVAAIAAVANLLRH